jgi:hypothetical protein
MYLPWTLSDAARRVPYQFTAGYVAMAALFVGLSFTKESNEPGPRE